MPNDSAPLTKCRWCGSNTHAGYQWCASCQKSQSWLGEHFGSTSSVVAVLAAGLACAQLVVSMAQNQSAVDAAQLAQNALKQVQEESSRVQKVEGRVKQAESIAQEASHNANEAFLKLKVFESRLEELGAAKAKAISDAKAAVESARDIYASAQAKLSQTVPTVDIKEPTTVTEKKCVALGFFNNCIAVPRVEMRSITRPNIAYAPLRAEVEVASNALRESEARLEKALK